MTKKFDATGCTINGVPITISDWDAVATWTPVTPVISPDYRKLIAEEIIRQNGRLLDYFRLEPMERAFLGLLMASPNDRDLLAAFCLWLREQGREEDAAAMEGGAE